MFQAALASGAPLVAGPVRFIWRSLRSWDTAAKSLALGSQKSAVVPAATTNGPRMFRRDVA